MTANSPSGNSPSGPHSLDARLITSAIDGFRTDLRYERMYAKPRWTPEHINSTVCGHLIVFWAMTVNLAGFLDGYHKPLTVAGMTLAILAITCAWLLVKWPKLRPLTIVLTIGSWYFALLWALR